MKLNDVLRGTLLWLVSVLPAMALAASPPARSAKLHELDVSAGHWVYHGQFRARAGAPMRDWTWHEACRWSANRVFMLCSFSNTWAGRHVNSVVVDTYDRQEHTFWHYEVFNSGRSAGKPFAARMQIDGSTRVESWTSVHDGRSIRQRIVYRFVSPRKVSVVFRESKDGKHWRTMARGTGRKTVAPTGNPHASPGSLRQ